MGRPRIWPKGTRSADRVKASTEKLKEAGGARRTYRLRAAAWQALQALMREKDAPENETRLVEDLLVAAAKARGIIDE